MSECVGDHDGRFCKAGRHCDIALIKPQESEDGSFVVKMLRTHKGCTKKKVFTFPNAKIADVVAALGLCGMVRSLQSGSYEIVPTCETTFCRSVETFEQLGIVPGDKHVCKRVIIRYSYWEDKSKFEVENTVNEKRCMLPMYLLDNIKSWLHSNNFYAEQSNQKIVTQECYRWQIPHDPFDSSDSSSNSE